MEKPSSYLLASNEDGTVNIEIGPMTMAARSPSPTTACKSPRHMPVPYCSIMHMCLTKA